MFMKGKRTPENIVAVNAVSFKIGQKLSRDKMNCS
jgi:hypothetical protein